MTPAAALGPAIAAELPRLRSFAYRLTRDAEAARDLIQDTAEFALRGAAGFQPGTNLGAWLRTIMSNRHWTRMRIVRTRQPLAPLVGAGAVHEVRAGQETSTLLREILALARRLPEHHRRALLSTAQGYEQHEIAAAMRMPIGSVKSSVSRARAMLAWMVERSSNVRGPINVVGP